MKNHSKILFLLILALLAVAAFIFTMCSKNHDSPEKACNYLKDLESYSSDVNIRIMNDKQDIIYETRQYYDKRFGYRLELGEDRVMIYSDDKIEVNDLKNNLKYSVKRDHHSLFELSLIGEYTAMLYTNEEINYKVVEIDGKKYQVIGMTIPGMNRNMRRAELYMDLIDQSPKYMMIYDEDDRKKVIMTYSNFKSNAELNKDLF